MPNPEQPLFGQSQLKIPPQSDEIEVTLFGKGVGESILIHFGDEQYAVIDSFKNPDTKNPVALDYLSAIGVPHNKIEMVVATHWHSDHIDGLTKVLEAASSSVRFVTYPIIEQEKFIQYLEAGNKVDVKNMSTTREFLKIFDMLLKKRVKPVYATHNKVLHNVEKHDVWFYALSPQDTELTDYLLRLNLPKEKIISYSFPADNDISVAIWLKIGGNIILLGGDLEEKPDSDSGWKAVIKEHSFEGKADLFKVPHHGSASSHNDDVWSKLLCEKPISVLSVFSRNSLPRPEDKERIKQNSSQTFIAGSPSRKARDFGKLPKGFNVKLKVLPSVIGIIRARKNISVKDKDSSWIIETFGEVEKFAV